MTNERLRSQIAAAGVTADALAERIGVDPKTVERWITKDRLPHRNHRSRAAQALQIDEAYLWPQVVDDPRAQSVCHAELLTVYPHRSSIPAQHWANLIHGTRDRLDVLVYSGLFLLDSQADLIEQLVTKVENGARIRLLFGEPGSPAVAKRAQEEGLGENLSARIRVSLDLLKPALGRPGVEVRTHTTTLYNSMYRFDDHLLLNVHAYGSSAAQNPVIHLRNAPGGQLFDHFMHAFDRVWDTATSVGARTAVPR